MNTDSSEIPESAPPFLPRMCLVLAFLCFLTTQVYSSWRTVSFLKSQEKALSQQLEQAQGELAQARTIHTLLEGLAGDLLMMSHTDAEIRKIVDKYQIRRTGPPPVQPAN